MNPERFRRDLEAKPAALRGLAEYLDHTDPWHHIGPARRVVMLGMGSSRYAAQVAARQLRKHGIDAVAEYASAEDRFPPGPETLTIAISATGTSRETLDAADGDFVALTNDPESELAKRATAVVEMRAGHEEGGVACRSFQHTQLMLHALVDHLTERKNETAALARLTAESTEDLLARRDEWLPPARDLLAGRDENGRRENGRNEVGRRDNGRDQSAGIFPIAPAERISSALQSALMFREGPRLPADGCETGDWAHVDVYLTKTLRYRAIFLPGSRYDDQALDWLHQRGSTILAVGGEVPGAARAVRFRHDEHLGVRLMTETLVSELIAADLWSGL
jgi:glutamine---fructose-6-phosphate transaminase (isomerizing)